MLLCPSRSLRRGARPSPPRSFFRSFTAGNAEHCAARRGLTLDTRRELGTIELQVKTEKNPDSVPVTYRRESICMVHLKACSITRDERFRRFQPEGTDWVVERKKQHIKGKLQDKFPSAEKCFSALDEDGGGSLDR
jgi:hypothetical protein